MSRSRPQSLDAFGAPWATRERAFRPGATTPHYVAKPFRGTLAGTPAYDAGAAAPHAPEPGQRAQPVIQPVSVANTVPSLVDFQDLPWPYSWSPFLGPVPDELWAFCADLASTGLPGLPDRSNAQAVAAWLGSMFEVFTNAEGCGVDPQAIKLAIVNNAPNGPHDVAYAVQQAIATSNVCARYIQNPLPPPARVAPPTPTGTIDIKIPNKPPLQVNNAKPFPWGWVLGGAGLLAVVGIGAYYVYRSSKRRKNPCSCKNPVIVEAMGYEADEDEEPLENPYGGTAGYTSIDGGLLSQAAAVSPLLNPSGRKRRRRKR